MGACERNGPSSSVGWAAGSTWTAASGPKKGGGDRANERTNSSAAASASAEEPTSDGRRATVTSKAGDSVPDRLSAELRVLETLVLDTAVLSAMLDMLPARPRRTPPSPSGRSSTDESVGARTSPPPPPPPPPLLLPPPPPPTCPASGCRPMALSSSSASSESSGSPIVRSTTCRRRPSSDSTTIRSAGKLSARCSSCVTAWAVSARPRATASSKLI